MGTNIQPVISPSKRGSYRQHTVEFKRAVVEQSLTPGASVSRIARQHNVNANQVFSWRKQFKEGRLGEPASLDFKLLPVTLTASPVAAHPFGDEPAAARTGVFELTVGKAQLRVEGHVDATMLSLVLKHLLP